MRRLLLESDALVFNLDKMGYASDLTGIEAVLSEQGAAEAGRHQLLHVELADADAVQQAVQQADPDLVLHLAAESHVDRSISGPGVFLESNVTGTYNLLQAVRTHYEGLSGDRKERFRLHHISTDEVFGSLGAEGRFSETTPYDPRSPYSASKAASDHLVQAWHHTFGLPVVLTNCSNNYGPWQFPEKLIPVVILKAANAESIPLYGDGLNVRDWLYVEDHVDALLLAACRGAVGRSYCVGGHGERTNRQIVESICQQLDQHTGRGSPQRSDPPGHGPPRPRPSLCHRPRPHQQRAGLAASPQPGAGSPATVTWYLEHQPWCASVRAPATTAAAWAP